MLARDWRGWLAAELSNSARVRPNCLSILKSWGGPAFLSAMDARPLALVTGRNDAGIFDHEHDGSLAGASAVENAFGNDGALARTELQSSAFEIDQEFTFDHRK